MEHLKQDKVERLPRTEIILSFHVSGEKFKELPLPDDDGSFIGQKHLGSLKGKLALTIIEKQSICVWVMREYGVHESWNKLCVVSVENTVSVSPNISRSSFHISWTCFLGFTKDGSLLIQKMPHQKNAYVLIDLETLHEKDTHTTSIQVATSFCYGQLHGESCFFRRCKCGILLRSH